MINIKYLAPIIGAVASILINPCEVNARKANLEFGVVLNAEGDGLLLDENTFRPVAPYYNYISYSSYNGKIKPGDFIHTIEFLDENGEVDSRVDYKTRHARASKQELKQYRKYVDQYDLRYGWVIDDITVTTEDGNIWGYDTTGYNPGTEIGIIFDNQNTSDVTDDEIYETFYIREAE